ncbi:hypothetical protein COCVIDRAFT_39349 [Bipolaris victoriae FI3]|uniref:DUF924-domain-containing protein n=1 Tax=Bipolaris victoriae (strain FI3) TaxID=930091 RepID=W7EDZ7_BIPV3|nr:hypothetical protein COCVIDRAFT_39349 [Bipolaris victoriae FI3]
MLTRLAVRTPLRCLTSSLYLSSIRAPVPQRTMSTSPSFKLDPSLFNRTLYDRVISKWFPGIDTSGQELDMTVVKRWFMASPAERVAFDTQCREAFSPALEAIGPDKCPDATAHPFLDELRRIAEPNGDANSEEAAWTALSMALLLDQIPRNIYRTDFGLQLVYNHYDCVAKHLVRTLLSPESPIPRPDLHPVFRLSSPHRMWFYMPLLHSEDVADHDFVDGIVYELEKEVASLEGYKGTKMFLEGYNKSAREHRDILDRFGRYPHRNGALGRESTEEEKRFLKEGGATFGVVQETKEAAF